MNKNDVIDQIAEKTGSTKAYAGKTLEATLEIISEALIKGDSVKFIGFGTFSTKDRPARMCRNPQTGKKMQIPAKKVVKFAPGSALKDKVA